MKLKYHQATFDLLGREPHVSAPAVRLVEERERACRVAFPLSVREWYALQEAEEVFLKHAGCDRAVALKDLGNEFEDWYGHGPVDFVALGLLVVMHENQGVCNWAVKLEDCNDPPVMVEVDSSSSASSAPEINWQPYADTFDLCIRPSLENRL